MKIIKTILVLWGALTAIGIITLSTSIILIVNDNEPFFGTEVFGIFMRIGGLIVSWYLGGIAAKEINKILYNDKN